MLSHILTSVGGANIKPFETNLLEIKELFVSKLQMDISLESPYKLCDYRCMYGLLFADYLKEYEFWGHCDNDLIFGDISYFITDEVLDSYDKILSRGHLTIYRNVQEVNEYFKKSENITLIPSWKDVITSPKGYSFDEWAGASRLWKALNPSKMYDELVFDDINYLKKQFVSSQKAINHLDDGKSNFLFEYNYGHLYRYGLDKQKNVIKEETCYVHFQKRPMKVETDNLDHFICKPNKFVEFQPITTELLLNWGKAYLFYSQYFKIRLRNLKRKIKEKCIN